MRNVCLNPAYSTSGVWFSERFSAQPAKRIFNHTYFYVVEEQARLLIISVKLINLSAQPITPFSIPGDIVSENTLVHALRTADRNAISVLYTNYAAAIYGIISRMVKNDELAEDILQDTFVKAWKCIHLYDPIKGRLFTWLSNMARNLAIDQIRSKYYRNNAGNACIDEHVQRLEVIHNAMKNPEHIGIKDLVSGLKQDHRRIIELVYFQGYTHVEAAEHLHIPVGTLKTRIRLAICSLRRLFN